MEKEAAATTAALEKLMVAKRSRFERVCVFCGSSPGNKASYQLAAIQLAHELVAPSSSSNMSFFILFHFSFSMYVCMMLMKVERSIDLVYGGGSIGLMGLVSQAVFDGGRHVLGYPCYLITISLNCFSYIHIVQFNSIFHLIFGVLQSNSQDPHAKRGNFMLNM